MPSPPHPEREEGIGTCAQGEQMASLRKERDAAAGALVHKAAAKAGQQTKRRILHTSAADAEQPESDADIGVAARFFGRIGSFLAQKEGN